jgi:CxxC motif-containing protein (DUF1111 family)
MRANGRVSQLVLATACASAFGLFFRPQHDSFLAADPISKTPVSVAEIELGRELFLREWLPNDPRSYGGDGLGPVFNDTSCVACHNQGGTGGGGPNSKNVVIVTAVRANVDESDHRARQLIIRDSDDHSALTEARLRNVELANQILTFVNHLRLLTGSLLISVGSERALPESINTLELSKFHPGFRTSRTIVLPNFGTEPEFSGWHPASKAVQRVVGGVAPTIAQEEKADEDTDSDVPYEVWRNGDRSVANWRVFHRIRNGIRQFFDGLTLIFKLTSISEQELVFSNAGLDPEIVASRVLPMVFAGSTTSVPRSQMIQTVLNEEDLGLNDPKSSRANLISSERNPLPLFGAGLIDSIPDDAIEQAAKTRHTEFPSVRGRVSRLPDGRIGKFGWKGQTASLRDFTLVACAVELGLNVPGHDQTVVPYKPDYRSPGLDMNEQECDALVAFIASLPEPVQTKPGNEAHAEYLSEGERLFTETGCAACHVPNLGEVRGIYSDLLLHDMGPALADIGLYESGGTEAPDIVDATDETLPVSVDAANEDGKSPESPPRKSTFRGPRRSEWRTPPLWGIRDSGPYLHHGGAETIPDAVALHGGEALPIANRFFKLSQQQRQQLISFLKSLTAP